MKELEGFRFYQAQARQTAVYPNLGWNFTYPTLGLCGEAGEVAENIKKALRDDEGQITPERELKLKKELGDVLWYIANLATELGIGLDEIAEENLKKLWKRQQENKIHGEGDER